MCMHLATKTGSVQVVTIDRLKLVRDKSMIKQPVLKKRSGGNGGSICHDHVQIKKGLSNFLLPNYHMPVW